MACRVLFVCVVHCWLLFVASCRGCHVFVVCCSLLMFVVCCSLLVVCCLLLIAGVLVCC